jgi:enhancing lycopene biosynthesis protein 2
MSEEWVISDCRSPVAPQGDNRCRFAEQQPTYATQLYYIHTYPKMRNFQFGKIFIAKITVIMRWHLLRMERIVMKKTQKIAVLLSGCGYKDGAEINEAVFTLLALTQAGATYQCVAPDIQQTLVKNYLTDEEVAEERNVLREAARIARGNILDLKQAQITDYDALILPGGLGAAMNLSNFATHGANMQVQPDVLAFVKQFVSANKPIGLICIAPTLAPHFVADAKVTIGNESHVAKAITAMGGIHQECLVTDVVVDQEHRIVSTPAFMVSDNLADVFVGIKKLVDHVLSMT